MFRRKAISVLLGLFPAARAADSPAASALLVDIRTKRVIVVHGAEAAARFPAPPGSTLKPIVLAALLKSGRLSPKEPFHCPRRLMIGQRSFDCSHPAMDIPMRVDTALAYSCNCFVAHAAERFGAGELAKELTSMGFASPTRLLETPDVPGQISPARSMDQQRMQALGEEGVLVTLAELTLAYRQLALRVDRPEMAPIIAGLEGAVQFGTAQRAQVPGVKVAGKTGSVRTDSGAHIAWFAGFMPSRAPEVVVAVMLQGRSGGGDAAPIAGRMLAAHRAGEL